MFILIYCKMKKILILLIVLFNIISNNLFAVIDIHSTFFTTNNGLGNNFARHISQDSKGFLWMSTLNGLTRYDGHSFVTFQPEKGKAVSIVDFHVRNTAEDKNNLLWIQVSPEYFSCYDLKFERFVDFTGDGHYKEKFAGRFEDSNGNNWLLESNAGCRKISYKDGKFQSVVFNVENGKLAGNAVNQIKEDDKGNIWVCTTEGLTKITNNQPYIIIKNVNFVAVEFYKGNVFLLTNNSEIYKINSSNKRVEFVTRLEQAKNQSRINFNFLFHNKWIILTKSQGHVFSFSEEKKIPNDLFNLPNLQFSIDKQGNICLFNDKGTIRYIHQETGKVKELYIPIREKVTDQWCKVIQDSRGWVWFATFGYGLYVYNPNTDEVEHITYQINAQNHICSNSLAYIFEDKSGGIWVTSESAGISLLKVLSDKVTYIYPKDRSIINNANSVRLIHQMKNGEIWFGNREGDLYQYDSELKKQIQKKHFETSIYALLEVKTGDIWYGSRGNGICINEKWIIPNNNQSPSEKISLLFSDYKDRTWMGTFNNGLSLITPNNGTYTFKNFFKKNNELFSVRSIASDKNNWMWMGTDYGLIVFHPDSLLTSPKKYYQYDYNDNKILANRVKYVFCDSKNRMWIGTMGGGLSLCIPSTDYANLTFKHFTTNSGLPNNVIQAIVEDSYGKIWISTEYGISRFSPETQSFENFYFSSIIQGNIYNESSVLRLPDNRLLFGTNHGIVIIDPQKINSAHKITDITLTDLKVNGVSMHTNDEDSPLSQAISYSKKIVLNHNQNSFSFDFSTFDYAQSNTSKYSYRLEPFDNEWSTPSALNFAAYKKLAPGTYHLRVKACNSAGIWSTKDAQIEIVIKAPFWATTYAYLFYIILLFAIIYIVFRVIRNFYNLRNKLQIEQELTDYKLMFFTNISHEFRTPLTIIKGALEKFENINNVSKEMIYPIQLMGKSTDRMLRLINQLLEFRKMQHNKLSLMLEQTDIIAFLQEIFYNFEEIALDKHIDYVFEPAIYHHVMFIDKGKVDKIVYNLLSNAFKYTPSGGKIVFAVEINEDSNQLMFCVSDTGVGIPIEKQRELFSRFMQSNFSKDSVGIGLHLTHELVNVHKGTIKYQENKGGGSVFKVILPLDSSQYSESDFITAIQSDEEVQIKNQTESDISENHKLTQIDSENTRKILLIEDDIDINKFLHNELGQYFDVVSATDGISGLELAKSFDGDLIVCDVMMPGMNGFEVTRQLKNNFETCHLPIILLTAMNSPESQLEGTKSGADAYITKPFSPKLLLARISQLIEQRGMLQSKFSKDPDVSSSIFTNSELDQKFLDKLNLIMEKYLDDPEFSIEDFSAKLNLRRTSFFRKVKGVTGYTPNEYMRIFRLKKAMEFLKEGSHNVSEVSFMVGINDSLYFSRCFKKQFGVAPSTLLRGSKENN